MLYTSSLNIETEFKTIYLKYQKFYTQNVNLKYILQPDDILISNEYLKEMLINNEYIKISNFKLPSNQNSHNEHIRKLPSILIDNKKSNPYSDLYKFLKSRLYKINIFITRNSLKKRL